MPLSRELLRELIKGEGWEVLTELLWMHKLEYLARVRSGLGTQAGLEAEGAVLAIERLLQLPMELEQEERIRREERLVEIETEKLASAAEEDDGF